VASHIGDERQECVIPHDFVSTPVTADGIQWLYEATNGKSSRSNVTGWLRESDGAWFQDRENAPTVKQDSGVEGSPTVLRKSPRSFADKPHLD
jgi:hypothetical protein